MKVQFSSLQAHGHYNFARLQQIPSGGSRPQQPYHSFLFVRLEPEPGRFRKVFRRSNHGLKLCRHRRYGVRRRYHTSSTLQKHFQRNRLTANHRPAFTELLHLLLEIIICHLQPPPHSECHLWPTKLCRLNTLHPLRKDRSRERTHTPASPDHAGCAPAKKCGTRLPAATRH